MNIRLDEALRLLGVWRTRQTSLEVHVFRSGVREHLHGTIQEIEGTCVEVVADSNEVSLDLRGAVFNGDESSSAYLVCEFSNGDRYSFSLLRSK